MRASPALAEANGIAALLRIIRIRQQNIAEVSPVRGAHVVNRRIGRLVENAFAVGELGDGLDLQERSM